MTEIVSRQSAVFVEALAGLTPDSLGLLRDMMQQAIALGTPRSTLFLRECQVALDSSDAPPAEQLAPVFDRWACEVTS